MRNNGETAMYTGLAIMRNGLLVLQWFVVQLLLTFNVFAIPFVFGVEPSDAVRVAVSMIGVVVHIAFAMAIRGGDRVLQYWDNKLSELEQLGDEESDKVRVKVFSHPDFIPISKARRVPVKIFSPICIAFIVLWTGISIFHGTHLL